MHELLEAIGDSQYDMNAFAKMNAGTISPAEFFAPANISRIKAAAHAARSPWDSTCRG